MDWVTAIAAAVKSMFDFFKPAEDTIHVYDIKKESGNKAIWIVMVVLLILVIGVILTIVLTR